MDFILGETHSTDRVWAISEGERNTRVYPGVVSFYRSGSFHKLMRGRSILAILEKGWGFPGIGPLPTFGP